MRRLATVALVLLTVLILAVYLPSAYEKLFSRSIGKTHLLFSPIIKRFIYREQIVGPVPQEVHSKAEDHHSEIAYRDEDGTYYSRHEFEKLLPFIYSKNMEIWGLLPMEIDGRSFDRRAIKAERQVLSLTPEILPEHMSRTPLWPLLESKRGQARLVFPDDLYRMTDDAMEFINADTNQLDPDLTAAFTEALKDKGFVFPARSVNTRVSVLKPFDEGAFMVDHDWVVYHVQRQKGRPVVIRTPIDPRLKTRFISVSENTRKAYYGLILAGDGRIGLLTYDNYRVIPLPVDGYDPDSMDFKLITDPLYVTAIWSDETTIHAVVMNRDYHVISRYSHLMSRGAVTTEKRIYKALFPFSIKIGHRRSGSMEISVELGSAWAIAVLLLCLVVLIGIRAMGRGRRPTVAELVIVACFGIYGLVAIAVADPDR